MKKKLLIVLIIVLVIIISLLCVLISSKKRQKINTLENKISEEEVYQNNVKGIELSIEGMSLETKEKIKDIKEFEQKLKEYAYENNFVNYGESTFKLIEERQKENILTLKLQANDMYKTNIIVDIKLNENTYEFYSYK